MNNKEIEKTVRLAIVASFLLVILVMVLLLAYSVVVGFHNDNAVMDCVKQHIPTAECRMLIYGPESR